MKREACVITVESNVDTLGIDYNIYTNESDVITVQTVNPEHRVLAAQSLDLVLR